PADLSGRWPVAKQRWKPIESIAESPSHEDMGATGHNPAKLAHTGLLVTYVMPNVRQPYKVTTVTTQRDTLGAPGHVGVVSQPRLTVCDCEHSFGGFNSDNVRLECCGK